jgi:hypothetical protein
MKKLLACVTLTLSLACQTYSAIPLAAVRPGNNVKMTVTNEGSLAVAPIVGRDIQSVEGRVTAIDTSSVSLLVESVNRGTDASERVDISTVRLAPAAITATELRRVDKPKSFLVAGLITIGAVLIAQGVANGGIFGLGHGGSSGSR